MKILSFIYFSILKLRYRFNIIGIEKIKKGKKYIIFPNHEALVDPQIIFSLIGQKISLSPVISETYYNIPILKYFFKFIGAVSVGDIQRGTGTKENIEKSFDNILEGIKNGKNILIYPAGQLYSQGYEVIRGKKLAFNLSQKIDDDIEIIAVKTTGLWGSIWSKAYEGKSPNFLKTFFKAIFIIISNLIFFIPKRNIKVEIENLTKELKNIDNLNDFNKYLEDFYNKDGIEEIKYLEHFFYFNDVNGKKIQKISGSVENTSVINENDIPNEIFEKIRKKVSEIKEIGEEKILLNSNIVTDLYFDSLDASEIKTFIQANFANSSNPPITDLKTIGDFSLMAMGIGNKNEDLKTCDWREVFEKNKKIYEIIKENKEKLGDKTNIVSLFKESFKNNKNEDFLYDSIFGLQTKKDFLIKAFLISDFVKKVPGKYIGVMLPSVSSASILIMSVYLSGKIPVMLNWTVGEASLNHCIKFANIDTILTSKNFYSKIKNESLEKINDKFLFLEEMLKDLSIFTKIKALFSQAVFKIPKIKYEDEAVILFTSGSESLPKAVSLSHKNIISDILGSLYHFPIIKDDILVGFLPPFHSFGFSINTIMTLISGMRVVYTPDPNDSKTIVNLIKHTGGNALTSTPTFLKMILNSSKEKDLEKVKYAVVGAEKCPDNLFDTFSKFCPNGKILEGYGITECSPVISLNPPSKSKKGSVGVSIFSGDIKIVSLETKEFLGPNKEGMIYFSGENVFNGYLDEKIESPFENFQIEVYSDYLIKAGEKTVRYYKTGDLGYLDEEGYLFITGRLKRFVKIAGEMISLPFIENILNKKFGSETENKIALEYKEEKGNVKIVLFSIDNLNLEEVQTYLRENGVSNLVKISEIIIIKEIPVLGTGKTDYKILKDMIKFEDKNYNFSDLKGTIIKKISELSKIEISKINENSEFGKDIFLDSIDVGELKIFVKTNYKIEKNFDVKTVNTVGDLIELVKNI